jgi:hypothetical protein
MNVSASVVIIGSTPEEVFQYVTEVSNESKWRLKSTGSKLVTPGPMRVGSEGYSTADNNGKMIKADWRVTEYVDNEYAKWDLTSGPLVGTGGYKAERVEGGVRLTLEGNVRMSGLGILLGPVVKIIGGKMNKADVSNLKNILKSD